MVVNGLKILVCTLILLREEQLISFVLLGAVHIMQENIIQRKNAIMSEGRSTEPFCKYLHCSRCLVF